MITRAYASRFIFAMVSSNTGSLISEIHISHVHGSSSERASEYLFLWALRGEFSLSLDESYMTLRANDLLMIQPGATYTLSAAGGNSLLSVFVRKGLFAQGKSENLGCFICNSITDTDRSYTPLRKILSQITLCYFEDTDISRMLLQSQAYSLLFYLNKYHYVPKDLEEVYRLSSRNAERCYDIMTFIESNYADPISLQDLCDKLYLTPQYLSRYIKRTLGQNFISYLNQVRLSHAVDDLLNTDHTIISVATNNGFSSINTFNKLFRTAYGTTPNRYREKNSNTGKPRPFFATESASKSNLELIKDTLQEYALQDDPAISAFTYPNQNTFVIKHPMQGDAYTPIWKTMINIGFSDHVHDSGLKEHMAIAQKEIGFYFGRLQAVLNDSMLPPIPESIEYNYTRLDRIIEYMLSIGMKPFLDLTYKVSHLLLGPSSANMHTESESLPLTVKEQFLVKTSAVIQHCINAFGPTEVESWGIEIGYLHDEDLKMLESAAEFTARFQSAYYYIKSLLPNILIGGISHNSVLPLKLLEEILDEMERKNFSPDFVSFVLFPFSSIVPPDCKGGHFISDNPDYTLRQVGQFKDLIERHPELTKKMFITVFGLDLSARNYVNDSCYQSAFLIKSIVELIGKIEVLGYWQLSDIGNTYSDSSQLLFGGNGIISQHGLKKPGFSALKRMSLARDSLVRSGRNYFITTDCRNTVYVVLYNYIHFSGQYCIQSGNLVPSNETYSVFDIPETIDMTIQFENLPSGNYRITASILNRDHGSILDEWLRYGLEDKLYPRDIQYFKDIVHPVRQAYYYDCSDGKMEIHSQLLPHEVRFIEIIREL